MSKIYPKTFKIFFAIFYCNGLKIIEESTNYKKISEKNKYESDISETLKNDFKEVYNLVKKLDKKNIFNFDSNSNIHIGYENEIIEYLKRFQLENSEKKEKQIATFIINSGENAWSTAVAIYDKKPYKYTLYYADPSRSYVPDSIKNYQKYSGIDIKIVLYTLQGINENDYVFFAIKNSFDINIILNDENIRAKAIDEWYDLYDLAQSLDKDISSELKSSSDFDKARNIVPVNKKNDKKDIIKYMEVKDTPPGLSNIETYSINKSIEKTQDEKENYLNKKLRGDTILEFIKKYDEDEKKIFSSYNDVKGNENIFNPLFIIENYLKFEEFEKRLKNFIEEIKNKDIKKASCTFIMNCISDHWITLVVNYQYNTRPLQ